MPFDFPSAGLVIGQTATAPTGAVYVWDGVAWRPVAVQLPPYAPLTSPVFSGDPQVPLAPVGDADQSIASTQFVTRAVAPAQNSVGRNLVMNPLMSVAQRGAGPWTTTGSYTADRWMMSFTLDTASVALSNISDASRAQIGDEAAGTQLGITFTGNAGATANTTIRQSMEGIARLANKTVTLSFYASASAALRLGISIDQYFGTGGSPSATVNMSGVSVTLSTSWTRYSVTLTMPSIAGKTLGTNADASTVLILWLSAGANLAARSGNIGVQSGSIAIWGVQLEIGSVATPLDYGGSIGQQLRQCQRFYHVGQNIGMVAGGVAGQWVELTAFYPATMRSNPTIVFSGTSYNNASGLTAVYTQINSSGIYAVTTAAGVSGFVTNYTASADL